MTLGVFGATTALLGRCLVVFLAYQAFIPLSSKVNIYDKTLERWSQVENLVQDKQ